MANQIHAYKDRDIRRIVKAARSAGLDPVAVEVDPKTGKIRVIGSERNADGDVNFFDQEAERLRRKAAGEAK